MKWNYEVDGNNSVWKSECEQYWVVVKHGGDGSAVLYDWTGDDVNAYTKIFTGVKAHKRAMLEAEHWAGLLLIECEGWAVSCPAGT